MVDVPHLLVLGYHRVLETTVRAMRMVARPMEEEDMVEGGVEEEEEEEGGMQASSRRG